MTDHNVINQEKSSEGKKLPSMQEVESDQGQDLRGGGPGRPPRGRGYGAQHCTSDQKKVYLANSLFSRQ